MNIFVLDKNPIVCARLHCDQHVRKMIVESAQLLSTAHHVLKSEVASELYRPTHVNHPCAIWVRESSNNYVWLLDLFLALCNEYTFRTGKTHSTYRKLETYLLVLPYISSTRRTRFVQCMPDQYKHACVVTSYRNFYLHKQALWLEQYQDKPHLWMKYTGRETPLWLN